MTGGSLDLHEIRRVRGGVVYDNGRRWVGPGPGHSRQDRSLSVVIATDGRPLVHSFAGDPFPACANHVGLAHDATPASRASLDRLRAERAAEQRRADAEAADFCQAAWSGAGPIEATPAESYLFSRGLIYEGDALRFHRTAPRSRCEDGPPPHPAMVALVSGPDGYGRSLHSTYLNLDGRKAFGARSRLMFGRTGEGAVRLQPIGSGGVLAVGEGIETALAFASLRGTPTWAALSTSGLTTFKPPANVRRLLIATDADDGGAGLKAGKALAERVQRQCDVEIHPAPNGRDWADEWANANG